MQKALEEAKALKKVFSITMIVYSSVYAFSHVLRVYWNVKFQLFFSVFFVYF